MSAPAVCVLAGLVVIGAIYATYRAAEWQPRGGKHARLFADPGEVPDTPWLRAIRGDRTSLVQSAPFQVELSHEDRTPLPATGPLEMLPPDPPPDETAPLPVVICELGMPTDEYLDGLFDKYAEVTA